MFPKVILLLFFALAGKAQDTTTLVPIAQNKTLYLGHRFVLQKNTLFTNRNVLDDLPLRLNETYNMSIYGEIYFKLNDKLTLQTGFSFHPVTLVFQDRSIDFDCESFIDTTLVQLGATYYRYSNRGLFLGLPLSAKIPIVRLSEEVYVRTGFEYLILLQNKERQYHSICGEEFDISFRERKSLNRKHNVMLQLGLGCELLIANQKFFIEPTLAVSLLPTQLRYAADYVNLQDYFDVRFLQLGMAMGTLF